MADETGLDVAKEAAKVEKPKPPTEPPKEKVPLGVPEQKIIDRIDKDGNEDKVLQDIASDNTEQRPAINVARVQSKAEGAFSVVSQYGTTTKEAVAAAVTKQAERVANLIRNEGGSGYWLEGIAGKAVVDQDGEIIVHQSKYPELRLRLATEYAASAAAISSLYTSTPDVQTLPPEAFRIEDDLSKQIDENGIYLPIPEGRTASQLKTRFYSIPGPQVDFNGMPVPLEDRHVLIVQDEPLEGKKRDAHQSEGSVRTYTVNSLAEIRSYLPGIIEKQRKSAQVEPIASTTETVSQQPPLETNYLTELTSQDNTPIFGGEIITPTDIKPLYRGLWADKIKDGDQIPVGGSIFSDELDIILEVDTAWMEDKTRTFTRERVDEVFNSGNEEIFRKWLEGNGINFDPETFHALLQVQTVTNKLLNVGDKSVANERKDHYLAGRKAKLSEFVGKSECAEQAIVGKLLLDKIGIKSTLMEGVHVDGKDADPNDHAFLILDDTQGEGSLIFDIARPKASIKGYPRILRSDKKLAYSTFEGKNNYVVPVKDIYNGSTLYYGVGHSSLLQDVNFAD